MTVTIGYDATGENEHLLPAGAKTVAGYTTGSGGVPWTPAQFAAHPGAIRICQDAGATDRTADVLDIEYGAATFADAGPWYRGALANRTSDSRPGQRLPCFYASLSNITPLANALVAEGITAGPRLWVAHWDITQAQAAADVTDTGPYPIVGYQFRDPGPYDVDMFAADWLTSGEPPAAPLVPIPVTWGLAAQAAVDKIRAAGLDVVTDPLRDEGHMYVSAGSHPVGGSVVPAGSHVILHVREIS